MYKNIKPEHCRVQVSNPPSGFSLSIDPFCEDHLGGFFNFTRIVTKKLNDGSVLVRVVKDRDGLHRIVQRTSGNRWAASRIVDRYDDVKDFPEEFGPILLPYELKKHGIMEFIVPPLHQRSKPIQRLRKQTEQPKGFFKQTLEPENEQFDSFISDVSNMARMMEKIMKDPELSEAIKKKFFKKE